MLTKSLSRVQIKDADQGTFSAVFSKFDVVDLDGDVTRKGAFTDGASVVISSYGHTSWEGALPIGKGVIHSNDSEAVVDGQFFLGTQHGKDAFETVKQLSEAGLQEWSYSLHNVKSEFGQFDGQDVRYLNSITVKEVSPVLKGAGIDTRTLAIKSGDMKFSDHRDAVLTALDEITARALEVVTLRAEQGKTNTSAFELHDALSARLDEFKQQLAALTTPQPSDDECRAVLALVASRQGVTIP